MTPKLFSIALIFSLLLAACGSGAPTAPTAVSAPTLTTQPAASPTAQPTSTPMAAPFEPTLTPPSAETQQGAAITAVQNKSMAREVEQAEYLPAKAGMTLRVGGGVQTGEDSRTTLNLLTNGTVIRVGPNSSFTVQQVGADEKSTTLVNLLFGKIWILLKGGSLEVTTPSGVASVRGSLLGVSYQPGQRMAATCLEGDCTLKNEAGEEEELTDDETAAIEADGSLSDVEAMTEADEAEWVNENPDAEEFFAEPPEWLPEPEPDYFGADEYSPTAYEDLPEFSPDEDPALNPDETPESPPDENPEIGPEESPEPPLDEILEPPPDENPDPPVDEEPPSEP